MRSRGGGALGSPRLGIDFHQHLRELLPDLPEAVVWLMAPACPMPSPPHTLPRAHSLLEVGTSSASEQLTLLPLGAWSRVRITGENITAEAGVQLPGEGMQVAAGMRSYIDGTLSSVVLWHQAKVRTAGGSA